VHLLSYTVVGVITLELHTREHLVRLVKGGSTEKVNLINRPLKGYSQFETLQVII